MRHLAFVLAFTAVVGAATAVQAPPPVETVCREIRVLAYVDSFGLLMAAVGPSVLRDSTGVRPVPHWPHGVLCSIVPVPARPTEP